MPHSDGRCRTIPRAADLLAAVTAVAPCVLLLGPAERARGPLGLACFGSALCVVALLALLGRAAWSGGALALLAVPAAMLLPLPVAWIGILQPLRAEALQILEKLGVEAQTTLSADLDRALAGTVAFAGCFAVFLLARKAGGTREGFALVAAGLLAAAFVQGVEGISQYGRGLADESAVSLAHGSFVNRGQYAGYLVACSALALGSAFAAAAGGWRRWVSGPRLWLGVASLAVVGVCLTGVALSFSRTGAIVALAPILGLVCLMGRRKALAVSVLALAALSLGAWTDSHARRTFAQRFESLVRDNGDSGRLAIWSDAGSLLAENPLIGTGLGSFRSVFRRSSPYFPRKSIRHAHSDWLESAVDLGPLVTAGLLLAIGGTLLRVAHRLSILQREDGRLAAGGAFGAVSLLIAAAIDFPLQHPAVAALLTCLLGLAAGRAGLGTAAGKSLRAASAAAALLFAGMALAAAIGQLRAQPPAGSQSQLLTLENSAKQALAENALSAPNWLRLAEAARARGELVEALRFARLARRIEPSTLRSEWPLAELEAESGHADAARARFAAIAQWSPDLEPTVRKVASRLGATENIPRTPTD